MIIKNARVFLDGAFRRAEVSTARGIITGIGGGSGHDAGELDLSGLLLLPGYIDVHTHGHSGADTMQGEGAVRHMGRALAKHGVTAFLPTTMSSDRDAVAGALAGVARAMADPDENGARVLGANMEGPFLGVGHKGAHPADMLMPPTVGNYVAYTGPWGGAVRLTTIDIEPDSAAELITYLKKSGVVISCGHSGASAERFREAMALGLNHVTHLFNAMGPFHHREPGVIGAALAAGAYVELVADLIHVHADALRVAAKASPERVCLITDAMMAAGLADGEYGLGTRKVIVKDGAARIPEGNLAGSVLTLDVAVRNMIYKVGLAPETVIPMATAIPADSVCDAGGGRIAVGCRADFVCVDEGYNVVKTIIGGRIVHEA